MKIKKKPFVDLSNLYRVNVPVTEHVPVNGHFSLKWVK